MKRRGIPSLPRGCRFALLALAAASCAAGGDAGREPAIPRDPVGLLLAYREAERRRDPELAARVLHWSSRADRAVLLREFAALSAQPALPVRTELEVRMVRGPAQGEDGLYSFLEPAGAMHVVTTCEMVSAGGGLRIVYEPPDVSASELAALSPAEAGARLLAARRARWVAAEGDLLAREAVRLRETLLAQAAAPAIAEAAGFQLAPFATDPAVLFEQLRRKSPEEVRIQMLEWLR